jgi:hypothetical protein
MRHCSRAVKAAVPVAEDAVIVGLVEADELADEGSDGGVGHSLGWDVLMLVVMRLRYVECRFADGRRGRGGLEKGRVDVCPLVARCRSCLCSQC